MHSPTLVRIGVVVMARFIPRVIFWTAALAALSLGGCGDGRTPAEPPPPCAGPGTICTVAGTGDPAFEGEGAPALTASLFWPVDVELAPDGRAYVLDWQNHRVRRIDPDGRMRTVIGNDTIGDGPEPGTGDETSEAGVPGTLVQLNHPTDVQLAPDGTVVLAAWHNHKIRVYDATTGMMHVACGAGPGFSGDAGPASAALLNQPKAIALAPSGDLYVADTRNFRVRRISATGDIATVVGTGMRGPAGDGGDPLAAQLWFQKGFDQPGSGDNPEPGGGLALDGEGRLYIADTENQRIRRVDFARGVIETVAGTGEAGFSGDGGPATAAMLNYPRDLEVAADGRLYIADSDNHRIRVVDLSTGVIDTVAGAGARGGAGDGGSAREALLNRPFGVGVDTAGDLYIADTFNNRIRRVVAP